MAAFTFAGGQDRWHQTRSQQSAPRIRGYDAKRPTSVEVGRLWVQPASSEFVDRGAVVLRGAGSLASTLIEFVDGCGCGGLAGQMRHLSGELSQGWADSNPKHSLAAA